MTDHRSPLTRRALLAGLIASTTPGCVSQRAIGPPLELIEVFDRTASTEADRRVRLGILEQAAAATPAGSSLDLMTYDRKVQRLVDHCPAARTTVRPHARALRAYRDFGRKTFLAKALEQAHSICSSSTRPVALVIVTDGEDHDPAASRAWATKLAACSGIKAVWIAGVSTDPRIPLLEGVRETFGAFGTDRLLITGLPDTRAGLSRFRQLLKGDTL